MNDTIHNVPVNNNGFPNGRVDAHQKDHVCFIQAGNNAPTQVTAPDNLFENAVTDCVVNEPNASPKVTYKITGGDGTYSIMSTSGSGNIKVNG